MAENDVQEQFAKIEEAFPEGVELDPELARHRFKNDQGWDCIQHPLHYSIMHNDRMNQMSNNLLRQKQQAIAQYVEEENYHGIVWMHERPWRLNAFLNWSDKMDDEQYWDLLGSIWTDSENIWQNADEWEEVLSSERPGRENLMETFERERLVALPDEFEIWRGYQREDRLDGMSWTLDQEKARWFAGRLWLPERGGAPMVAHAKVKREKVIAFFDGRAEHEIVVLPGDADIQEVEEIEP